MRSGYCYISERNLEEGFSIDKKMILIALPSRDENRAITRVLFELLTVCSNSGLESKILIIDDGSQIPLSTTIGDKFSHHNVLIHRQPKALGKSAAYKVAMKAFLGGDCKFLAFMDSDGEDDPRLIPELVAELESDIDFVHVVRHKRRVEFHRLANSWIFNLLVRGLTRTRTKDVNSGLKAMTRSVATEVFDELNLEGKHRILPVIAELKGFRASTINGYSRERLYGESHYKSFRLFDAMVSLRQAFGLRKKLARE